MILDTTEKSIVAYALEAAVTPIDFYASFIDTDPEFSPQGSAAIGTITQEETTIVPAPSENTQTEKSFIRVVKTIFINNRDADNHYVQFLYSDLATKNTNIILIFLQPKWAAEYECHKGWTVYNEKGVKVVEMITVAEGSYILGDGIRKITVSPTEPIGDKTAGDLWIDTNVS